MKTFTIIILIGLSAISLSVHGQEKDSLGFLKPIGWVNDFENIFTQEQIEILDSIITHHESQTTNQITIVTLDTIFNSEEELADYSLKLINHWGVGVKGKNNGLVILFGVKMRKIRIENGYGIENKLSDKETKEIIDKIIIPEFKKENYFEGIRQGLLAIIEKIK